MITITRTTTGTPNTRAQGLSRYQVVCVLLCNHHLRGCTAATQILAPMSRCLRAAHPPHRGGSTGIEAQRVQHRSPRRAVRTAAQQARSTREAASDKGARRRCAFYVYLPGSWSEAGAHAHTMLHSMVRPQSPNPRAAAHASRLAPTQRWPLSQAAGPAGPTSQLPPPQPQPSSIQWRELGSVAYALLEHYALLQSVCHVASTSSAPGR